MHDLGKGKCDNVVTFGENDSNCSPVNNLGKGKCGTGATFGENNSKWTMLSISGKGKLCNVAKFEKGGEVMPDGITLFLIGVALGVYMGRKLREIGEQLLK